MGVVLQREFSADRYGGPGDSARGPRRGRQGIGHSDDGTGSVATHDDSMCAEIRLRG